MRQSESGIELRGQFIALAALFERFGACAFPLMMNCGKDADPDIPIFTRAKAEYAKLN
jgi:hypothetical protein